MPPPDSALKRLAGRSNPAQWFISVLEGVQNSVSEGRQDPGWFHPSMFGEPCDANLAFWFLGAPAVVSTNAKLQRIFDNGNCRDEFLKQDTAKAGISLVKKDSDRKIELSLLHIRGELDEWVANPANQEQAIIDFKTMHTKAWTELKEVKHSHHLQIMIYEFGKGVHKGFVLYENKDTQEWKLMPANFDNKIWQEEIIDRTARILKGLENDTVYRTPVNCTGCPFNANGVCASNQIYDLKVKSGLYV